MNQLSPTTFELSARVICTDGPCGHLVAFVVDPDPHTLTHLAVLPAHHRARPRLVARAWASTDTTGAIRLDCDIARWQSFDELKETELVRGGGAPERYALSPTAAQGAVPTPMPRAERVTRLMVHDRLPEGEVLLDHHTRVDVDGRGRRRLRGLVIDPHTGHIFEALAGGYPALHNFADPVDVDDAARIDSAGVHVVTGS